MGWQSLLHGKINLNIAVLWGGLLHSNLAPTPSIHLQLGWEPITVLWVGCTIRYFLDMFVLGIHMFSLCRLVLIPVIYLWYRSDCMVKFSYCIELYLLYRLELMVMTCNQCISSVILNHTHTKGPSVAHRRDFARLFYHWQRKLMSRRTFLVLFLFLLQKESLKLHCHRNVIKCVEMSLRADWSKIFKIL